MEDNEFVSGGGLHFEKTFFGNDLMTAEPSFLSSLSLMDLNLLRDTGWYQVNLALADKFEFGRNHTCSIF